MGRIEQISLFNDASEEEDGTKSVSPAEVWEQDVAKRALDELFNLTCQYKTSKSFHELMQFVAKFRFYSPFNAMLVHVQMPGARFVAPPHRWVRDYSRQIKTDARPLVILQPMGPVMFVFDVSDTEPTKDAFPLPPEVENPFEVRKGLIGNRFDRLIDNAKRDGLRIIQSSDGSQSAGSIRHIAQGVNKKSIRAVAERPELFTVSINGSEVPPAEGEWYLEQDYGVYEIGRHLKTGENLLSVEVRPMSIFAEPAAVMLTGGFSLRSQKAGWRIEPEQQLNFGPWKEQGLPFYADGVKYSRRIEIEERPARAIVRFDHWKGTVAEVRVNGVQAGAAGWRPYEADITEFLQAGENAVDVVIYGSLKNTLGPHHFVRRRGIVTPWSFKYAPEILPGGDSYDLLDYGLIKDFKILMVKK